MLRRMVSACTILAAVLATGALAQAPAARPDPYTILGNAKVATGGVAWDRLRTQHSKVTLHAGGMSGKVERWSDLADGRSYLKYALGSLAGTLGYNGSVSWSQEGSAAPRIETAPASLELAANAAFRDRLAFWFAERGRASVAYKGRAEADGAEFDIVTITPEGGRPFDFWVNTQTGIIERLVEAEVGVTRTEIYMDFQDVKGLKIPFRVRVTRGDPKHDELVLVDAIEFDAPLAGVNFAPPVPPAPPAPPAPTAPAAPAGSPKADFGVPAGKAAVITPRDLV